MRRAGCRGVTFANSAGKWPCDAKRLCPKAPPAGRRVAPSPECRAARMIAAGDDVFRLGVAAELALDASSFQRATPQGQVTTTPPQSMGRSPRSATLDRQTETVTRDTPHHAMSAAVSVQPPAPQTGEDHAAPEAQGLGFPERSSASPAPHARTESGVAGKGIPSPSICARACGRCTVRRVGRNVAYHLLANRPCALLAMELKRR